jgi:hypothetical protein
MGGEGSGRPEPAKRDKSGQYKKEGCFIATVVYGSYEAPEVLILRHFRDQRLGSNVVGRLIIDIYYWLSPPAAKFLSHSPKIALAVKQLTDFIVKRCTK